MKYSLLLLSCLFSLHSFAQKDEKTDVQNLFPKAGDFGATIMVDGLIDKIQFNSKQNQYGNNLLFSKYYLTDQKVFRLGFGLDVNSQKREQADSVGTTLVENDSTFSSYLVNFSFGYEFHLASSSRLDPYLFTQLDLTFIGKNKTNIDEKTNSVAGIERNETVIKADGGVAVGILAGGGFNYFLAKRFSIGAELAIGLQYSKDGGTISTNKTHTPFNGNRTVVFDSREDVSKITNIGVKPKASIQLSYFF